MVCVATLIDVSCNGSGFQNCGSGFPSSSAATAVHGSGGCDGDGECDDECDGECDGECDAECDGESNGECDGECEVSVMVRVMVTDCDGGIHLHALTSANTS